MTTSLLQLNCITKSYGNLVANSEISLNIYAGSIHALLGENGAGKSTLVNIIYGLVIPDSGEIWWEGQQVGIHSPVKARELGIGIVFQHFALFSALTILENIALGIDYRGSMGSLEKLVQEIIVGYKLEVVDLHQRVSELSVGEKQRVEIIRCLMQQPKLLILDEPTSVLTPREVAQLFETLEILKNQGCAIIVIGHKLDEIKAVCETATIIRKGKWIAECCLKETNTNELAEMMIGNRIAEIREKKRDGRKNVVLQFNYHGAVDFSKKEKKGLNYSHQLQLKSGMITGLVGIAGNGQDQLMSYLSGEVTGEKESIQYWNGQKQSASSSQAYQGDFIGELGIIERKKQGIVFVPTERLGRSAVMQMNLMENAFFGVSDAKKYCHYGLMDEQKISELSENIVEQYNVHPSNKEGSISHLSGGNLQKYIVGRAMLQDPKVLLISNPTWGVDISSATFIRNRLIQLRDSGAAILIASEDLDEIFAVCDEMVVIKKNQLSDVQPIENVSIKQIAMMMVS